MEGCISLGSNEENCLRHTTEKCSRKDLTLPQFLLKNSHISFNLNSEISLIWNLSYAKWHLFFPINIYFWIQMYHFTNNRSLCQRIFELQQCDVNIGGFCKAQNFVKEWNLWPKTTEGSQKTVETLRKIVEFNAGCSCRTDICLTFPLQTIWGQEFATTLMCTLEQACRIRTRGCLERVLNL